MASAIAAAMYFRFGSLNLNPADEGFLWYGVLQTRAGQVPVRDFQSYDAGRYYWCVAWSFVFGQGILGLRASLSVVQGIGLFLGLRVCRRVVTSFVARAICAAVLASWMFPMHKIFEPAIATAAVLAGIRLFEAPTARRLFEAGALVGLAGWLGRNHGLYCGLAFVSMIGLLLRAGRLESPRRALTSFALGGAAGSAPLWIMLGAVPGFATALWEAILFNLTTAVNLPLPYPWPWRFHFGGRQGFDLVAHACTAIAFSLPLVLYPAGLIIALRTRPARLGEHAPIVAATFIGIFFMHHASVRSDIAHLAQVIHPLLFLVFVLVARSTERAAVRVVALMLVAAWTCFVVLNFNPLYAEIRYGRSSFVAHDVAGDTLRLPSLQAAELTSIEAAIRSRVAADDRLFVAPTRPVLYPILGKTSPTWGLYFLFPASELVQNETIERLETGGVTWALILDEAIDNRDDLRFKSTNPLVWTYLIESFDRVDDQRLPSNYYLLRRRDR
jgi:hypothetical protein